MPLIEPSLLKPLLGPLAARLDVDSLECCDSTNTRLMERGAQGAPSGSVLVADEQTAGRGRRGRRWLSSPQDSLTFSLLWRIPAPATRIAGLSLAVGLGLIRGLQAMGLQNTGLKWPNDLLMVDAQGSAKLAGILIELSMDRKGAQAVIGIGLNLRAPGEDVGQRVAGLADVLSTLPGRHEVLASLLGHLVPVLDQFVERGFSSLREDWQARHLWQGQQVKVLDETSPALVGRCLGVDDEGALLIESAGGTRRILAGEVSLRVLPS